MMPQVTNIVFRIRYYFHFNHILQARNIPVQTSMLAISDANILLQIRFGKSLKKLPSYIRQMSKLGGSGANFVKENTQLYCLKIANVIVHFYGGVNLLNHLCFKKMLASNARLQIIALKHQPGFIDGTYCRWVGAGGWGMGLVLQVQFGIKGF